MKAATKTSPVRLLILTIATCALSMLFFGALVFFTSGSRLMTRSPAERTANEIAALSVALESYKADNGDYPSNAETTRLRADTHFSPKDYITASKVLYRSLAGTNDGKVYFEFSTNMVKRDSRGETYIVDPNGCSYGYSTAGAKNGPNFFDLWSTGSGTTVSATNRWIVNW